MRAVLRLRTFVHAAVSASALLILGACSVFFDVDTEDPRLQDNEIREVLTVFIGQQFQENPNVNIRVHVKNQVVLLVGNVESEEHKKIAVGLLEKVPEIRDAHNQLVVGPATGIGARVGDTLLQNRVRLAFLNHKEIPNGVLDIIVRDNHVYLLGKVTEQEATDTVRILTDVVGVENLTGLFEFVDRR